MHTLLGDSVWNFFYPENISATYGNSQLARILGKQRFNKRGPVAIFTDIDRTFYHTDREAASWQLTSLAQKNNWPLIAISGCDYGGILKRIKTGELPYFQVIVGSVGTEVWVLQTTTDNKPVYKKDIFFERLLQRKHFDRSSLVQKSLQVIKKMREEFVESSFDFQDPIIEQKYISDRRVEIQPFKISFYFFADNEDQVLAIQRIVKSAFPHQVVIVCGEVGYNSSIAPETGRHKYCLDILPVGKGRAFEYIRDLFSIKRGVVAGDSGNDVDMLKRTGSLLGVLVGGYESLAKKSLLQEDGFKAGYIDVSSHRKAAESILQALKSQELN